MGGGESYFVRERSRENKQRKRAYRSVLDRGLRFVFEEDEVEEDDDFWMDWGSCGVDEDEGFVPTVNLVEATERLIAAIAALLLADTSLVKPWAMVFTVSGFDGVCVVVVLQV